MLLLSAKVGEIHETLNSVCDLLPGQIRPRTALFTLNPTEKKIEYWHWSANIITVITITLYGLGLEITFELLVQMYVLDIPECLPENNLGVHIPSLL